MSNCKKLLPQYFKNLSNSNLSKITVNLNKRLIIAFLKEYFAHNNTKYSRNRFNHDFFNKFFNEILPKDYPEFTQIPFKELHSNINNFFNYLTLKNILNTEISQLIARNLDNEIYFSDFTEKLKKLTKDINRYQEESEEYSEKKLHHIMKKSNRWMEEFIRSNYSKNLSSEEKNQSSFIIELFFEYLYNFYLKTPEQVNEDDIEEICLRVFPKKVSEGIDFFKAIVPVLINFFKFLENKSIIHKANILCAKLSKLRKKIINTAQNPENWGLAKSLVMNGQDTGIDLKNETALISYINTLKLAKNYMDYTDWWTNDKVEALNTEEIIKKLQSFGIPFEKKHFLTDTHQVYSAYDIVKIWRDKYTITAEGRDDDFIWIAASILWKRLAPEVISSEKLDDMMQEGYDLIATHNYVEGCTLWLQVWEYLKERFRPEMTSIHDAEEVFGGLQSLYNWSGDLTMELYIAGTDDREFFRKRIKFCKESLEFFPESNVEYIQLIIRSLGESYYQLGLVEKGNKIFLGMIEKFPKYEDGYICWGDQYSGFWDMQHYDYKKALSIYKRGLENASALRDELKERIEDLEEKQEGLQFKENLLSDYESYLSEKNLSKKLLKKKLEHCDNFLDCIIFYYKINNFEIFDEKFGSTEVLKYLGYWAIQEGKISSKTCLIEATRYIKSYIYYLFNDLALPEEEVKKIKRILNSKEFFMKRLEDFQKIEANFVDLHKKFQKIKKWREGYIEWYSYDKQIKLEEERLSKKVALSDKKRKLFKNILNDKYQN